MTILKYFALGMVVAAFYGCSLKEEEIGGVMEPLKNGRCEPHSPKSKIIDEASFILNTR